MNIRMAGPIVLLGLLAACGPMQSPPVAPAAGPKPATGDALDRQLVDWCLEMPDTSDQRCRCWPVALRAEGLADADLRDLLVRLGAAKGVAGQTPPDAAYATASANCGLAVPLLPAAATTP